MLSTVLLVTLYRTPASLEAGWKYFILCGVGIAQALFGTILVYFASEKLRRRGRHRAALDQSRCSEGTSSSRGAGHRVCVPGGWRLHQGGIGAAPQLASGCARGGSDTDFGRAFRAAAQRGDVCGGSLQGAGRRVRSTRPLPSQMLMGFGLTSVVLATFFLWRQRDIKRLFAYSSVEHMGIITFAFGMGGRWRISLRCCT